VDSEATEGRRSRQKASLNRYAGRDGAVGTAH